MSFTMVLVCFVISAAVLAFAIGAYAAGKIKLKRAIKPIEFYPPRGYSPIDVMNKYFTYNADPHSVINPLMLYWASRGFITIEEDCKRGLKLTKLKDLEPPEIPIGEESESVRKNYETEKTYFDALFQFDKVFYTLAAPASMKKVNETFTESCKKNAIESRTNITQFLSPLVLFLGVLSLAIVSLINLTKSHEDIYITMLFPIIGLVLIKAIPFGDPMGNMIKYPFITVWGGAPFVVVLAFAAPMSRATLAVAFVASLISVILSLRLEIKSNKDVEMYGRIAAFKRFLLDAEIDRLETLIEDNPNYYFDILPYCYILKITKKLKPKFERITTDGPSWYLGSLRDTLMF